MELGTERIRKLLMQYALSLMSHTSDGAIRFNSRIKSLSAKFG